MMSNVGVDLLKYPSDDLLFRGRLAKKRSNPSNLVSPVAQEIFVKHKQARALTCLFKSTRRVLQP